jgi:hypothetical protein
MFVKTLVKPLNISKLMIIEYSLFSMARLFEFKHYFSIFLSCSDTLLCLLISTLHENNENWKLSEDYILLD